MSEGYDFTHLFDVQMGSGSGDSIDDLIDTDPIVDNDGRSKTATYFLPGEVEYETQARKQKMYYLAKLNDGMYESDRMTLNRRAERFRMLDVFSGQLELTTYQKERAAYIMECIDKTEVGFRRFGTHSSEKVILGIITFACEEDSRVVADENMFIELQRSVEMKANDLNSIRRLLKKHFSDVLY